MPRPLVEGSPLPLIPAVTEHNVSMPPMRAVRITAPGGPEVLQLVEVPRPRPEPHQLLVRVHAAGVNRADVLQRLGPYPAPPGSPPDIPGLEFAGEVERGAADRSWKSGERVMGLVGGGAYAEFLSVDARHVVAIPEGWSYEEAAAIPEAFITADDALRQARLAGGERVLVHAVGSGVGTALLQLAKAVGAVVAGSSRTPAKLERAADLGLDRPILVRRGFAPDAHLESWADVICDLVGAPYLEGNLRAVAPKGRIVLIGLTGGRTAEVDLRQILGKRVTVIGTVLRGRSAEEKAEVTRAFAERALPLLAAGTVRPVLDRVFAMGDAPAAHRYMEENRNFGAIVLSWSR